MDFYFDRTQCLNMTKALKKEWLQTNGLGSYASSTVLACNTRKYHGLFNINLETPPSRYVLLSTIEESIYSEKEENIFSTRQHPDVFYPNGHENLESVEIQGVPTLNYKFGNIKISKEVLMVQDRNITLVRYFVESANNTPLVLKLKPLLAYREIHELTYENDSINKDVTLLENGFAVQLYKVLPQLNIFVDNENKATFKDDSFWCKNVHYAVEKKRGFNSEEDLYCAGCLEIPVVKDTSIYLAITTEEVTESLSELWNREYTTQKKLNQQADTILKNLELQTNTFLSKSPSGMLEIIAGYPWFQAWGRDTLIALPGICFATGRIEEGKTVLENITKFINRGLIPNMFSADGNNSYNSIDASLWFVLAVQSLEKYAPSEDEFIRKVCYPAIKAILSGYAHYASEIIPDVYLNKDGLIHTGNYETQLTWMDAQVNGEPVTSRFGYVVEINALWFNALCYAKELSIRYGEDLHLADTYLETFAKAFREKFWTILYGGYLGDVESNGSLDLSIRPNQIFAVSLPYSVLSKEDQLHVVDVVRNYLLTPYGVRTLSRRSLNYKGKYEGNSEQRDSAYHQGTVWPWLLGAYGDALIKTSTNLDKDVDELLNVLTSLFTSHMSDAGIGSISEIFAGDPPQVPDGCIAQAWSVSECYRLLQNLKQASPKVFTKWEEKIITNLA